MSKLLSYLNSIFSYNKVTTAGSDWQWMNHVLRSWRNFPSITELLVRVPQDQFWACFAQCSFPRTYVRLSELRTRRWDYPWNLKLWTCTILLKCATCFRRAKTKSLWVTNLNFYSKNWLKGQCWRLIWFLNWSIHSECIEVEYPVFLLLYYRSAKTIGENGNVSFRPSALHTSS